MATRAMLAEEGAMQASANNLANVNTPGYSRQIPIFQASDPVVSGSETYGNGVELRGFQSLRDRILDLRIAEEQQNQARYESYTAAMNQVQVLFSDPSGGIGGAITGFFNSISSLSGQADSRLLRQGMLTAAQSLVTAFHTATTTLSHLQDNLDLELDQAIDSANQLTSRIASLNGRISSMQKLGQDPGTFIDQREQAIAELSNVLDISETQTEDGGLTITTANGVALAVDGQSFALSTAVDPATALHRVWSGSVDLTALITKGSMGGTLAVRDVEIPQLQASLDKLAGGLSTAVNTLHQTGIDLYGAPGGLVFSAPPAGAIGAAALIELAITDPSRLAMSTSAAAGGNQIAVAMLDLKEQGVVSGETPIGAYSQITFQVGSDIANAQAAMDTSSSILQQLESQQSALSAVSIDEETANLLQFQRGFQAAAHVVTVIDSLMQTVISMGVTR